jgi:hypothetical protein
LRDPSRIPLIIMNLNYLWNRNPDLRLGQLVENLSTGTDTFNLEDDEMLDRIIAAIKGEWPRASAG